MKVLICTIAVLIAGCSAGNGGGGGQQSFLAEAFNIVHQQQPIVKDLKVIEVVRQNDQHVSTVVKNIKVVHDAQHPKLQDVKALHVVHQAQQPSPKPVEIIQIVHQPQEVKTIQVVHEQAVSTADRDVNTISIVHGNDGLVAHGAYSGGGFGGYFYGAALSGSSGSYSNLGTSAGYFYGGAPDNGYGDISAGGTGGVDNVLEILQSLKIIGTLSPYGDGSTIARYGS